MYKALVTGDPCIGIFDDPAKAFERMDHEILFSKLENLGIRGKSQELLRSYFSNYFQKV